jgi:hypothetical protein
VRLIMGREVLRTHIGSETARAGSAIRPARYFPTIERIHPRGGHPARQIGMMRTDFSFLFAQKFASYFDITAQLPMGFLPDGLSSKVAMKRLCNCVLALIVVAAYPVFGQENVGTSGSLGASNGLKGEAKFQNFRFLPRTVRNAPYSGELVTEVSLIGSDNEQSPLEKVKPIQKMWRDSQGRVRTEQRGSPVFQISDPVAMYIYFVDTVNRVVHRVKAEALPERAGGRAGRGGDAATVAKANGRGRAELITEDLGSQTIDGFAVASTRTTTVIPGSQQRTIRETWVSTELHLDLLSVEVKDIIGTRPEKITRKIINLSTSEPDSSLFTGPSDYSIVDEPGDFSIKWGVE